MKKVLFLIVVTTLSPSFLSAQTKDIVSVNPLGVPLGIAQVQYESGRNKRSVGLLFDYFSNLGDATSKYNYQSVQAFYKHFPWGTVGRGTSVEGNLGVANIKQHTDFFFEKRPETVRHSSQIMSGVGIGHSIAMGTQSRWIIEGGLGIRRSIYIISKKDEDNWDEAPRTLPSARLLLGITFN